MVSSKNKNTLSPLGFDPDLSGPVGAVSNRTAYAQLETVPTKRVSFSGFPVFSD